MARHLPTRRHQECKCLGASGSASTDTRIPMWKMPSVKISCEAGRSRLRTHNSENVGCSDCDGADEGMSASAVPDSDASLPRKTGRIVVSPTPSVHPISRKQSTCNAIRRAGSQDNNQRFSTCDRLIANLRCLGSVFDELGKVGPLLDAECADIPHRVGKPRQRLQGDDG